VLDADAGYAHEQSREQGGYVTSLLAGAFLREVAGVDVDALAAESVYDPQTREYFRRRWQLQRQTSADAAAAATEVKSGEAASTKQKANPEACEEPAEVSMAGIRELAAELEQYERTRYRGAALLTGPEKALAGSTEWVRTALGRLHSEPAVFDARMDELTYLANLLISGAEAGGDRLTSDTAANLAVATCNLGASHELWLEGEDLEPVDAVTSMLDSEPGLVRLFRIGWCLLARLPRQASQRLGEVFADESVRGRLSVKPWVLGEVDALIGSPSLEQTVANREFEDARETIKILGIALEPEAVAVLCVLTDGVPRFARALEEQSPQGAVVSYAARDFATMSDLMLVHRFLDGLDGQVRM